jgi:DNA invertase Pin-like site-specific DNA recombinase
LPGIARYFRRSGAYSAAGTVARAGFGRMVADVCLGKIGAVAVWKVSRLVHISHNWLQFIEM